MELADRPFFERVAAGYQAIAKAEPNRIRVIEAAGSVEETQSAIWRAVAPLVATGHNGNHG